MKKKFLGFIQVIALAIPALTFAEDEEYFSEKYHAQYGLRLDYSNLHLQDPQVKNYGTDFNSPSFEFLFSTVEGKRIFGFGWGGDSNVDTSSKPTRITFNQFSVDQYLDSNKSGLFFKLKGLSYSISITDLQSETSWRTVGLAALGFSHPFNEYFSISAYAGQLFDSITSKKWEYQIGIYFDAKATNDSMTNLKQDFTPKGPFFLR